MSDQARRRYPRSDRFTGRLLLHLSHLVILCVGVYWLSVINSGIAAFGGVWIIGYAVFSWVWSTRFAWRTWWDKRSKGLSRSEPLTDGDLHEKRVRLAFAHPYVVIYQSFFVMFLMLWAAANPEFLSLHHGVWFYLSVLVIWGLVSLFSRYIGRSELRDFEHVYGFDAKKGRFASSRSAAEHDS